MNKILSLFFIAIISFPGYAEEVSVEVAKKHLTVYGISHEEFQALGYIPQAVSDINSIAREIVEKLHVNGFVATEGFVISDSEIFLNQGLITITNVFGVDGKANAAVKQAAQTLVGKRPNVNDLDEMLAHINALSGVDATFALESSGNKIMDPRGWTPDGNTTHYSLLVKVADQAQSYGALSVDSTPRDLFNRNRATLTQTFNSVFVGGDHIQGSITHIWGDNKKDQNEGSLTYFMPLSENGLYTELYASYTASKNEVQPNVQRDFQGTNITATLGFPVIRSHDQTLTVLGGGGYQVEEQEGLPDAEVRALNTTLFYNNSDPEGNSFTTSVTLTSGDAHSQSVATENGGFSHLRLGAGYIHALNFIANDTELRVEGYGQITDDSLPSAQRFVLGGSDFLRGYPTGVYSGNQGAAGTIEIGHKYFLNGGFLLGSSIKAFWDTGYVSNNAATAVTANKPKSKTISSLGLAFSADFTQGYGVSGWLGKPLDKGNQGESLSPALYLRLTKSW